MVNHLHFAIKVFLHSFSLDCEINEHKQFSFSLRTQLNLFLVVIKELLFHARCYLSVSKDHHCPADSLAPPPVCVPNYSFKLLLPPTPPLIPSAHSSFSNIILIKN